MNQTEAPEVEQIAREYKVDKCLLKKYYHILTRIIEAVLYQIGCFFYTLCKGGGGSNPCVKIYVVDFYNSVGLLTT